MSKPENTLKIIELARMGQKLTPMMQQYHDIKKNYLKEILLFRMGDFYEVFFEDAHNASKALNIALTHRGKIGDYQIPMAGIPYHAASTYFDKLTHAGYKLAICEQVEDPKEAIGIVKRAVTQMVTPGMPYDLDKTDKKNSHFIVSTFKNENQYFLVALDFTSGKFIGEVFNNEESFLQKLNKVEAKEVILSLGQWEEYPRVEENISQLLGLKTHLSQEYFSIKNTQTYIEKLIPHFDNDQTINKNKNILIPVGAIAYYLHASQNVDNLSHIKPFSMISSTGSMSVSYNTLLGLEVLPKAHQPVHSSLIGFLDHCCTSLGSRYIKELFLYPLDNEKELLQRQTKVEELIGIYKSDLNTIQSICESLNKVRDLERILAKASTRKINATDLINTANSIQSYNEIRLKLSKLKIKCFKEVEKSQLKDLTKLQAKIHETLNDELGASLNKGNLIRPGVNSRRDELSLIKSNSDQALSKLEEKYRKETGINILKIKSNNVFGYFIEVSKSHVSKVPEHFKRRQTLTNSERYTTDKLKEFEKEIFSANERLELIEKEIFNDLIDELIVLRREVQNLAVTIADIDCFLSFSKVSYQEGFCRPVFTNKDSARLTLQGVWHPLIKATLHEKFITHDINIKNDKSLALITGPNMAGKTTIMREIALIQLLAQVGCFVPAKKCELQLCDALFSRLGANDDILKGRSTFMVEMAETAEIVRHASQRSLVILDEVGRGTSTYDGLSIAWSLVEHLLDKIGCLTFFATHYHELIELAQEHPRALNLTVEIKNTNGNIDFLYNLIEGAASQSFGIHVAKLAGLPQSILKRSKDKLKQFEKHDQNKTSQLDLFQTIVNEEVELTPSLSNVESKIRDLNLLEITPLKAMNFIDELKKELPIQ